MLTYDLKKAPGQPLYESLYRHIRADILSGALQPGEKLPSKRTLAAHLEVSKITVEAAYAQLLSEGFLVAREKVGYFVEAVTPIQAPPIPVAPPAPAQPEPDVVDLTANGSARFPFSVWSRLQREVMLDFGEELLRPLPNQGHPALRQAIARHLAAFRGMEVDPENVLIGAGTDFLYNLLIQLLGRDKCYAVENPGYGKIMQIYAAGGAQCITLPMDRDGVIPASLADADVLHISPNHHFPTGQIMPVSRRLELLSWAARGGWIIEDDYDSEFRFDSRPKPAMQSLDRAGRVIYMNTFSKTLAPSIRISYMVLPTPLMERFRRQLGFYSCTVPSFEQYTLERFLSRGHFEKHINRMRKFYKSRRNLLVDFLENSPISQKITILEQDAGLHFLIRVATEEPEQALTARFAAAGIRIRALSEYYHGPMPESERHCLVVNYDCLSDEDLFRLSQRLSMLEIP